MLLIYLWSERELRSTAARMLSLTRNTVGNVYAVVRHYCGRDLQDRPVVPFGGRVYVVKSDESQFKHKSKVGLLSLCTVDETSFLIMQSVITTVTNTIGLKIQLLILYDIR